MNRRDSSTKNFRTPSRSTYIRRMKKRRARQTVLLCLLSVLILILLIAVVFVIRDLVRYSKKNKDGKPEKTGTISSEVITTVPAEPAEEHFINHASDGDISTYFLSSEPQKPGAWLMFDFGSTVDIGGVSVISGHLTSYIRSADIEVSEDGVNWDTVGEIIGTPLNNSAQSFGITPAKKARYARIILTASAQDSWAVNEFTVTANNGAVLSPASASIGIKTSPTGSSGASEDPNGFENKAVKYAEVFKGYLILVNNYHLYVYPESDVNIQTMYDSRTDFPGDGAARYSYQVGDLQLCSLDYQALREMNRMCDDFFKESGINSLHVGTNSGYRSKETQEGLYAKYPLSAAKPRTSDHETGFGVNFDIYEKDRVFELSSETNENAKKALTWLDANAYKYGFVQRYPAGKDSVTGSSDSDRYHYRYVGYPHAYYMTANNLCLEEYLSLLEGYTYSGKHLEFTAPDNSSYEIYFVSAADGAATVQVPVPKALPYTISGNNYNGFVVTIKK